MRPSDANDTAAGADDEGGRGEGEGRLDVDVDVDAASELMKGGSLSCRRLLGRASVILRRVPMKPAVCWSGWVAVRAKTVQTATPPTDSLALSATCRGGRTNSCDVVTCRMQAEKSSNLCSRGAPATAERGPERLLTMAFWGAGSGRRPASTRTSGAGCRASSRPGSGCRHRWRAPRRCDRARCPRIPPLTSTASGSR